MERTPVVIPARRGTKRFHALPLGVRGAADLIAVAPTLSAAAGGLERTGRFPQRKCGAATFY
jgi:hypothetical protein